jgi:glutaredoxin
MYTIIGKANCVWCDKAASLLGDETAPKYFYFDLDSKYYKWLKTLMVKAGYTTVPLIFEEGLLIGGYAELEMHIKNKESEL